MGASNTQENSQKEVSILKIRERTEKVKVKVKPTTGLDLRCHKSTFFFWTRAIENLKKKKEVK